MPAKRSVTWQWLSTHSLLIVILGLVITGVLVYWPILDFSFFWEDPFDIGQVDSHSYTDLFLVSTNNLYYRPLHLVLIKLLKLGQGYFSPTPFFAFNVITRVVGSLLLLGFARRLTGSTAAAAATAFIFLLSPIPYDSTAKAMSAHQALLLPFLLTLWLYLEGRLRKRPLLIGLAMAAQFVSLLVHELGILLPLFILGLEAYLGLKQNVSRFSKIAFVFLAQGFIFGVIWLAIPKEGTLLVLDHSLEKLVYLSQSLSFPIAGMVSRLGGFGLEPITQALLAFLAALLVLVFFYWRKNRVDLLFLLFCWFLLITLIWSTLSLDYLWTGSRLLLLPTLMSSLVWGGLLLNRHGWSKIVGPLLILLILSQGSSTLIKLNSLYQNGSLLMEDIVQVGQRYEKLLYINVPDRFEYKKPVYPIGFWGMMFAPVSQSLADFITLDSGITVETLSLSNFPLADDMRKDSPYLVNSRGSDAYGTALLYDSMLWADMVFYVNYSSLGELDLAAIGDLVGPETQAFKSGQLASFGKVAELTSVDTALDNDGVTITTTFRILEPAGDNTTLFFHLLDGSGHLVAQADGDTLNGLIPLRAWREGNYVVDIRSIPAIQEIGDQSLQLLIGFYDRSEGIRLAVDSKYFEVRDNALIIPIG